MSNTTNTKIIADQETVERLANTLVGCYEGFVSENETRFVDALMGAHNFYKLVIQDLERRTGDPFIGNLAVQMLERYLIEDALKNETTQG